MTDEEAAEKIRDCIALDGYELALTKDFKESLFMALGALEQQQNIITQIEQARDKDKNAGEYPYNRCIEIIKGANNGLH